MKDRGLRNNAGSDWNLSVCVFQLVFSAVEHTTIAIIYKNSPEDREYPLFLLNLPTCIRFVSERHRLSDIILFLRSYLAFQYQSV